MKPAERELAAYKAAAMKMGVPLTVDQAFLSGRAHGLRAALLEHDRPLVAQQAAKGVMRDWDEAAVQEGGLT